MGYRKVTFRHADALASMPWDEFERLMARHYASRGYQVEHVGTGAQTSRRHFDGGIDLKLFRDGEYIVVQCKRENVFEVTHNVVHELIGVMHTQHATRAIVVNTGEFSAAAIVAAAEFPQIELIDGLKLRRMLAETGDLPTAHWTDDILASLADTRRRRNQSPRTWGRRRNESLTTFLVKAALAIAIPLVSIYVIFPFVFRTATAPLIQASQRAATPRPTTPRPNSKEAHALWEKEAHPLREPEAHSLWEPATAGDPATAGQPTASGNPPANPTSTAQSAFTNLSKKEAEAWDKKNAESMRILEKTTPSLQ
jgi:hypothetical protein